MSAALVPALYLLSATLFVLGLRGLTRVRTARRGNALAALAMLIAVAATLWESGAAGGWWIAGGLLAGGTIGAIAASRVAMTAMPEMVALFNGAGGGASALVALAILWLQVVEPGANGALAAVVGHDVALSVALSVWIGALTLSGSMVAYLKLAGTVGNRPPWLVARNPVNAALALAALAAAAWLCWLAASAGEVAGAVLVLATLSLAAGVLLVLPIGGADMPVVISLLNALSGVAAAMTGFVLANPLLIIAGALVGASGLILTRIMCVAMNRTLSNVLFTDFGDSDGGADTGYGPVRSIGAEEAALVLESAARVVLVPGYGLAVSQAQHALREIGELLEKRGAEISYAIHPVAGRMPGHMNVLLAEADVSYEKLLEMDQVNPELRRTDVVLVVGANDVVNPAAETNPASPIAGMPVLRVWEAGMVLVVKRSLGAGYAGVKNELFERPNTAMVFGDAKQVLKDLVTELELSAG